MFPFLIRFKSFTIKRVLWLCPSFGPLTCAVGFCFWLPGGPFSPFPSFPFLENYYWKDVGNLCPKELWPVSGGLGSATACDLGGLFVCGWSVWETALPGWSFLGASCRGHLSATTSLSFHLIPKSARSVLLFSMLPSDEWGPESWRNSLLRT